MALSKEQINSVEDVLKASLRNKFQNYKPETDHMPFHYRLLGKDRMALFSFLQSLNTTFGTSIYEPVAKEIAKTKFKRAETQYMLGNIITQDSQNEIQKISVNGEVDKTIETDKIRSVAQSGKHNKLKSVKVDLFLESKQGEVFMFDLKTVKPNKGDFISYKRNMLEWLAVYFFDNPKAKANTLISIPYNPYEPKPYTRWTMKGMLDLKYEVMVAEEFWDFLGGKNTYKDLLDCFERVGIELRDEIDNYFKKFVNKKK